MSVPNTSARSTDTRHLFRIINTVSSTLDLDRVLRAIVDLVSDAIDCHACFIYLVAADGSLVLRSVSDPYGALVDRLRFERGEGLAGWVAEHNQPVFLTEGALTDPRAKVVPEADEEQYQSIVAVPLRSKAGDVVGVISLHAEAPREFTEDDSDFLVHAASLVAGAIENARLYEHTRRRLTLVEGMADLARAVSAASTLDQLLPAVARRAQRLLGAIACEVYVASADGTLELGAASPAAGPRDADADGVGAGRGAGARSCERRRQPSPRGAAVGRPDRLRAGRADGRRGRAARVPDPALPRRPPGRSRRRARWRRRSPARPRSPSRTCT